MNIDNLVKERYIISWAASYVGKSVVWSQCVNSKEAKRWNNLTSPESDSDERIVKKLHELMSEADIIAGHNVNAFDVKHCAARFLYYGLEPIVNKKTLDTLIIARSKFKFESNKLDYISQRLGFRPKDAITNEDWKMALTGDAPTLRRIEKYNCGDVVNGKKVLASLMPWSGKRSDYGSTKGQYEQPLKKKPITGKEKVL